MRRANTFNVRPLSHRGRLALIELLDSSAACFNEINYDRRQAYFSTRYDSDDYHTVSELKTIVRTAASQEEYRNKYIQQLSSSIPQQLERKNWQTWTGFFELLKEYRDPEDDDVTDEPSPPGYWKEDDKRQLHTVIRNDTYSVELGERSRVEIPMGKELKEKYGYGHNEKLRVELRGRPHWEGPNGSLELVYDRTAESFTAHQSVGRRHTDPVRRFTDTPTLATTSGEDESGVVAAVDIGANNLAAVVTSEGDHVVFHGRPCFERFHNLTAAIADLQSRLPENRYSTERIERLYRRRREQRDHAQDALVRHLARWLLKRGVTELYVGELDDVREEHWSATVNEKTDLFWAHGRFRDRLEDVLEGECGITVHEESEAGTSSTCPLCGAENVHRSGDDLQCLSCGFEGHSDIVGAVNFLVEQAELEGGPMARPVARGQNSPRDSFECLEWDDHRWQHRGHSTKEEPADRSTTVDGGNLASGGTGTA